MKHLKIYKQPTSTTIHIFTSHLITVSTSENSGVNKDGNTETGGNIEEGSASGAHAKPFEWEE